MPFDPSLPQENTPVDAVQMRGQLNGLKALIDALAAGTVTAVVVDAVNTVAPGNPASVSATVIGNTLHLTFSIPSGNDGPPGPQGINGNDGQTGPQGEVSNAALTTAISDALATAAAAAAANSSAKSNTVATLDVPFANDPPTVADMETLRAKMNELIAALRR